MKVEKTDLFFLAILTLSSLVSLLLHFISGYVLSINDYAGFLFLAIILFFQYRGGKFRSGIPVLLILGTFNILCFSYITFNSSLVHLTDDLTYNPPGFNPAFFLMLVVYGFINFNYLKTILGGNRESGDADEDKMTDFYYNKFSDCDPAEFKDIAQRINMYPAEAQAAIRRLIEERTVN